MHEVRSVLDYIARARWIGGANFSCNCRLDHNRKSNKLDRVRMRMDIVLTQTVFRSGDGTAVQLIAKVTFGVE